MSIVTRAISTAGGGTALTTTAALITIPRIAGRGALSLTARNFAGSAEVVQFALNPRLTVLLTTDNFGTFTDDSIDAQDGLTTTDFELDGLTTVGRFYVGAAHRIRGFAVDMDASEVNSVTSVLTMRYWNGSSWADTSDTDGTASGGATMAVDGNVTFTVPTDWVAATLFETGDAVENDWQTDRPNRAILGRFQYWLRGEVSATITNPTSLNQLRALNESTSYTELVNNQNAEVTVQTDENGDAAIEALVDADTANLVVNLSAGDFF